MNRNDLLLALKENNIAIFRQSDHIFHLRLQDDLEIIVQEANGVIPQERVELLKHILENEKQYIEKAMRQLKSFHIEIGEDYFCYGIYVGAFPFGTHGLHMFDGFTMSFKRGEGCAEDPLNMNVYTVQFKQNGHPLGVDLWFE